MQREDNPKSLNIPSEEQSQQKESEKQSHHHCPRRMVRRPSKLREGEDEDPLSVIVNLFDVAMVFAVSLMVAIVLHLNMSEFFGKEDFTVVKNPGQDDMEIITKEGKEIKRYVPKEEQNSGTQKKGKRVGTAYQLENGEIIYIPE